MEGLNKKITQGVNPGAKSSNNFQPRVYRGVELHLKFGVIN